MPKLPSPDGARATPRAVGGVVDYGQRRDGIAPVANAIAEYAGRVQERDDAFAYAAAKSKYLVDQSNFMREIESEPDFEKYEEMYVDRSRKALESAGEGIRSARDREVFGMELELQQQRGLEEMRTLALNKKRDSRRADIVVQGDAMVKLFSDPTTPDSVRMEMPRVFGEMIDSAAAEGVIPMEGAAVEKLKVAERGAEGYALALIQTGQFDKAADFLRSPIAEKALMADRRAQLLNLRDEQGILQQATNETDSILTKAGNDRGAAYALANDIADAKLRREVLSQIDAAMHRKKMVDADAQEANAEFFASVIRGAAEAGEDPGRALATNRALHGGRWSALSTDNQARIQSMLAPNQQESDNAAFTEFSDVLRASGPEEAKLFLKNNSLLISPALYRSLYDRLDASPESVLTDTQRISQYAEMAGLTDKEKNTLMLDYERRIVSETPVEGELAPSRRNAILENLIVESAGRFGSFGAKRTIELDPESASRQFDLADEVRASLVSQKKQPTLEIIQDRVSAYDAAARKYKQIAKDAGEDISDEAIRVLWFRKGMPDAKDIQ